MGVVENLKWRYATKKFKEDKKLSNEQLNYLKEAVRLSVSAFGLQLYKVLVISDPELKKAIQPICGDQTQIPTCSHLFIFCNYKNYNDHFIDDYILRLETEQKGISTTILEDRRSFVKSRVLQKTPTELKGWLERQPYLAVSSLLMACAEQQIDACPIEGFTNEAVNEYFDLDSKNLNAVVMVATGFRAEDDSAQHRPKIRKSQEDLFEVVGK
jgi:nitroreductase/dihydropteridine reductase